MRRATGSPQGVTEPPEDIGQRCAGLTRFAPWATVAAQRRARDHRVRAVSEAAGGPERGPDQGQLEGQPGERRSERRPRGRVPPACGPLAVAEAHLDVARVDATSSTALAQPAARRVRGYSSPAPHRSSATPDRWTRERGAGSAPGISGSKTWGRARCMVPDVRKSAASPATSLGRAGTGALTASSCHCRSTPCHCPSTSCHCRYAVWARTGGQRAPLGPGGARRR